MGYVIRHSTGSINRARKKGKVAFGVSSKGYNKTSVSGLYNGVPPVAGKHNLVRVSSTDDPDFYALSNAELINFANQLGGSASSVSTAKTYLNGRDDIMFTDEMSNNTIVSGSIFEFDFTSLNTYPGSGVVYYDLSGNNYHASASSNTTYVEYDSDYNVVNFGGGEASGHGLFVQDLNYVSGDSDELNELTIDTLVKASSLSGNSHDQRIILSFDRSAVFRFAIGGDAGSANNPGRMSFMFIHGGSQADVSSGTSYDLRDDKWHRIALTFKSGAGNGIKYYVDGEQVYHDTNTYGNIGDHNDGETPRYGVIGAGSEVTNGVPGSSTAPESIFTGSMASIKYYNTQLSQTDILQNYYGGPIVTDGLVFATDAGNLVSYESGSTTAYNLTGSNDLTLRNGLGFNSNYGGHFDVDGSNDGLDTPDSSNLDLVDFTVEGWVWWNEHKNYGSLLVKGPGGSGQLFNYSFFFYASYIRVGFGDGSSYRRNQISTSNVPINQWHHIVGTYDGSSLKFYVNGSLINTESFTQTPYTNTDNLNVIQTSYPINGKIAVARVYNRALTPDEVLQNYNAQKSRFL